MPDATTLGLFAAVGISAVVASSATAFTVVAGWPRRRNEGAGFRRGQRLFSGGGKD